MIEISEDKYQDIRLDRIESFQAAKIFLENYYWDNQTTELRTIVSGMQLSSKKIAVDADTLHTWREAIESTRQSFINSGIIVNNQSAEEHEMSISTSVAFFAIIKFIDNYNDNWKSDQFSKIIADVDSARVGSTGINQENIIWNQWLEAVATVQKPDQQ